MMEIISLDEKRFFLELAKKAARVAGEYLRREKGSSYIVKEEGRDIKLRADLEAEKIILDVLLSAAAGVTGIFPAILAEESGPRGGKTDLLRWIIDPLDGSYNYYRGLPFCALSIALWSKETPLLGIVYDFLQDELYEGIVGEGAFSNEQRIYVSSHEAFERASLCTGFPVNYSFHENSPILSAVRPFKKIRMLGSAALSLALVASGKMDYYWERGILLWDVAGGLSLLSAAGGKFFMRPMETAEKGWEVFATNGHLPVPFYEEERKK